MPLGRKKENEAMFMVLQLTQALVALGEEKNILILFCLRQGGIVRSQLIPQNPNRTHHRKYSLTKI